MISGAYQSSYIIATSEKDDTMASSSTKPKDISK